MKMIVLFASVLLVLTGLPGITTPEARGQFATTASAASGVAKSTPVSAGTGSTTMPASSTSSTVIRKSQRLAILIWAAVAGSLAILVVIIAMSFIRATRRLLLGREVRHAKTPYVDAWKLAGKRLRPPPPPENSDELSDSPDP